MSASKRGECRKRFNVRLVLSACGLLVVVVAGTHFLHRFQVARLSGALLQQAEARLADGQRTSARSYFKRYVRFRPHDAEALRQLALLQIEAAETIHDYLECLLTAEAALRVTVDADDLRRIAAGCAMRCGEFRAALRHYELLTSATASADLYVQMALCHELLFEYSEAAEAYGEALERDPGNLFSYRRRTGLLRERLDAPQEAGQLLEVAVLHNPQSVELLLLRADDLMRQGLLDESMAHIEEARRVDPLAISPVLAAARLSGRMETPETLRFQELKQQLEDAIGRDSSDLRILLPLAEMEFRSGDLPAARNRLTRGLELSPDQPDFLALSCLAAIRSDDMDVATHCQDRLQAGDAPREVTKLLNGLVLAADRQWGPAASELTSVRHEFDRGTVLATEVESTLLQCYRALDAREKVAALLREQLRQNGFSSDAKRRYAQAMAADGQIAAAISQYRELDLTDEDALPLARLLVRRQLSAPGHPINWDEVNRLLTTAAVSQPDSPEVAVLQVATDLLTHRPDEARKNLHAARERIGNCVELDAAAVELELRLGRHEEARRALEEAVSRHPDRPEVWNASLNVTLATSNADPQKLARLEAAIEQLDASDQPAARRRLASFYRRSRQFVDETRLRHEVAVRSPDSLAANRELVQAALRTGNKPLIVEAIERLRRIEGERGTHWRSARISLALADLDSGDSSTETFSGIMRQIDELERLRPDWSVVWSHRGILAFQRGQHRLAIQNLRRAYELGYRPSGLIELLARLYIMRGAMDDAEEILQGDDGARLAGETAGTLELLGAAASARIGETDRARALARDAIRSRPRHARGYLLLARINLRDGRLAAAEAQFRQAVEVEGESGAAWVGLIRFLHEHRSPDAAMHALQTLRAREDVDPLTLAQCYEACGSLASAEKHYVELEQSRGDDAMTLRAVAEYRLRRGQADRAEVIIRQLTRIGDGESTSERLWAIRRLAGLLAARGTLEGFRQALELLEDQPERDLGPIGQRQLARMLARRPELDHVRRAKVLFTRLHARKLLGPVDQVQFCRVLETLGEDNACEHNWAMLVEEHGGDAYVCTSWLTRLLDRGRVDDAEAFTSALPDSLRSLPAMVPPVIRLHLARGDFDSALQQLDTAVFSVGALTPLQVRDRVDLLNRVADALHSSGAFNEEDRERLAEAIETGYSDLLAMNVNVLPDFLGFLAAEDRFEEAWHQLMMHDDAALPVLLQGAVAILRYGKLAESDVDEWIERLAERVLLSDSAGSLAFEQLAQIRDLQGDSLAAERLYRAALQRNPDNVIALNNLAWLISAGGRDPAEARQLIERALNHVGRYPWLLDTLAQVQLAGDNAEDALETLEEAIEIAEAGHRYFLAAIASEMLARSDDAAKQFALARGLGLSEGDLHRLERPHFKRFATAAESDTLPDHTSPAEL
ncbi:tetratricopeptide repeat protein [Maioricimonas rarisocia]|uniref:Tetratricopeptide repeat protein n=1 Tax=Maioricimonas rarisocia TaxID=2528026 RepID=A0A517ZB24_9PLAN|nr:tetratricopeptide repeat protein [Maioricimonas rarisocia]QDU39630.1 tetratricopeptide repeat protein [Maioricimonas rarisocia]